MKLVAIAAALAASLMLGSAAAQTQSTSQTLARLFADERAAVYRADPMSATYAGVHDYDDRLGSVTPQAQAAQAAADQGFIMRLHAIDRAGLTAQEQVSYDLFDFMVGQRVRFAQYN